jgi:hypothetical protein
MIRFGGRRWSVLVKHDLNAFERDGLQRSGAEEIVAAVYDVRLAFERRGKADLNRIFNCH